MEPRVKMSVRVQGLIFPVSIDELDVDLAIPIETIHMVITGLGYICEFRREDDTTWMIQEHHHMQLIEFKPIPHKKLLSYIRWKYNQYARIIAGYS